MPAPAGKLRGTLGEVAHITKAGTPLDSDFNAPQDGMAVVDLANAIVWTRESGRWMSGLFTAEIHPQAALTGTTTSGQRQDAMLPAILGGIYLVNAYVTWVVLTTNNGTNFWTLQLSTKSTPNTDTNRGASFTTASGGVTTYNQNTIALGITLPTTELSVGCTATSTGAPGAIVFGAVVHYRLIAS